MSNGDKALALFESIKEYVKAVVIAQDSEHVEDSLRLSEAEADLRLRVLRLHDVHVCDCGCHLAQHARQEIPGGWEHVYCLKSGCSCKKYKETP